MITAQLLRIRVPHLRVVFVAVDYRVELFPWTELSSLQMLRATESCRHVNGCELLLRRRLAHSDINNRTEALIGRRLFRQKHRVFPIVLGLHGTIAKRR